MKMSSVILILVIICGAFLIAVLFFLAYLNWSYKVQASLISIILVGTGTILVTIFSGLKNQTITERFVTTVFVNDTSARFEPFPSEKSKVYGRTQILRQYSDQAMAGEKNGGIWFDKYPMPSKDEEWFDFNREALTYDLFKVIQVLSASGAVYDFSEGIGAIGIQKIEMPSDCQPLEFGLIKSDFEKFHGIEYEGLLSGSTGRMKINLPKGTSVKMYSVKEKDHFPVSILEFEKKMYFKITFKVMKITEPNLNLPTKLIDPTIDLKKIRSYSYMVEINSDFEKYSSSGDKSAQYVNWASSIFAVIKQRYDDKNL